MIYPQFTSLWIICIDCWSPLHMKKQLPLLILGGGGIDDCLWGNCLSGDQHCWSWGIDDHLWGDQYCWSLGWWIDNHHREDQQSTIIWKIQKICQSQIHHPSRSTEVITYSHESEKLTVDPLCWWSQIPHEISVPPGHSVYLNGQKA